MFTQNFFKLSAVIRVKQKQKAKKTATTLKTIPSSLSRTVINQPVCVTSVMTTTDD